MFGISFEHLIIVGVILLIVGPRRLPELGNTLGKSIKNFKDSFAGIGMEESTESNVKRMAEKTILSDNSKVTEAQTTPVQKATASEPTQA